MSVAGCPCKRISGPLVPRVTHVKETPSVGRFRSGRGVSGPSVYYLARSAAEFEYSLLMEKTVVPVQIRALIPTNAGCAVFLGNEDKVFVIYVDQGVGAAIGMFLSGADKERPLTHDLLAHVLAAVGARVERVVINDLKSGTYFGRLILSAENELQQKKIIELDARPSDCMAMAAQQKAPIYVSGVVWEEVEDTTELLRQLQDAQSAEGEEG